MSLRVGRHDHWAAHAEQWAQVGQPLRPGPADIAIAESMVGQALSGNQTRPRALVLGVTPELVGMAWPPGMRLIAVDRCPGMIRTVLPKAGIATATGVCGQWLDLPLSDHSLDLVIGDGCFTVLESPAGHQALGAEVHRVLGHDGHLVMRFFARPDRAETVVQVHDDLAAGRIGNFHIYKWRLAMALQAEQEDSVAVADIWSAWQDSGIDARALSEAQSWPLAEIETIRAYRDATARYTFPRLGEVRAALDADFVELSCRVPEYELGERCPTLLLRSKS